MSKHNLMTYMETTMKEDGCTLNAAIRDTLTDLMHLCTIHHIDFKDRMESAKEVHMAETNPSGKESLNKNKTYLLYNIKYDTDGTIKLKLPTKFSFTVDSNFNIAEEGANLISNKTGWCVLSFKFKSIKESK